jgi:hypothetical protein
LITIKLKTGLEKVKTLNRFRNFRCVLCAKISQLFIFVQTHKNEQKSNFNDFRWLGKIARPKSFCNR